MIPWLKRFFNDEAAFEMWWSRAKVTLRALLTMAAIGMMNGTFQWPAWVPPWLITVLSGFAVTIVAGAKAGDTKKDIAAIEQVLPVPAQQKLAEAKEQRP